MGLACLAVAEEENSAQRLESAQKGLADASWPRKPDSRLSTLSGKMKQFSEISPRFYGQDKEVPAREAVAWQKEAFSGKKAAWAGGDDRRWEEVRWNHVGGWADGKNENKKFQPNREERSPQTLSFREIEREAAPDWSARPSVLAGGAGGSLRMYEGRLTRVREQVLQEADSQMDLGSGRKEKYNPEEVQKMLAQPVGELRAGIKEESGGASPRAIAGN